MSFAVHRICQHFGMGWRRATLRDVFAGWSAGIKTIIRAINKPVASCDDNYLCRDLWVPPLRALFHFFFRFLSVAKAKACRAECANFRCLAIKISFCLVVRLADKSTLDCATTSSHAAPPSSSSSASDHQQGRISGSKSSNTSGTGGGASASGGGGSALCKFNTVIMSKVSFELLTAFSQDSNLMVA